MDQPHIFKPAFFEFKVQAHGLGVLGEVVQNRLPVGTEFTLLAGRTLLGQGRVLQGLVAS